MVVNHLLNGMILQVGSGGAHRGRGDSPVNQVVIVLAVQLID